MSNVLNARGSPRKALKRSAPGLRIMGATTSSLRVAVKYHLLCALQHDEAARKTRKRESWPVFEKGTPEEIAAIARTRVLSVEGVHQFEATETKH